MSTLNRRCVRSVGKRSAVRAPLPRRKLLRAKFYRPSVHSVGVGVVVRSLDLDERWEAQAVTAGEALARALGSAAIRFADDATEVSVSRAAVRGGSIVLERRERELIAA